MLRPVKIRQYVSYMNSIGFSAKETLRGSGIDEKRLNEPSYLLDTRQCECVVSNMIHLTGNQAVGFDIGLRYELSDFGVVAEAMRTSRTLGEAIEYWVRYSNLVGMLVHITLVGGQRGAWNLVYSAAQPMGFVYNFCVEEILASGIKFAEVLGKRPVVLEQATLSYPAPLHSRLYDQHLKCAVRFNASRTEIKVKSPALGSLLPGADAEINEIYRRHCREVLRQIDGNDPLITRIRGIFLTSQSALPDLNTTAKTLGTSSRTLRRKLLEENTSYKKLADGFRKERVLDLIQSGNLTVKEVASLVGFKDANSLRRAFKAWTNITLGHQRAKFNAADGSKGQRDRTNPRVKPANPRDKRHALPKRISPNTDD